MGLGGREGEQGSALIFTLLVLTTLTLLGAALLTMAQYETRMAFYQYRETAAFYLAEAGLQKMGARLTDDPFQREDITICWDGGGKTQVSIQEEGDYLRVFSRGEKEGVQSSLVALLQVVDHTSFVDVEETIMCAGDFNIVLSDDGNVLPRVVGGVLCSGEVSFPESMDISISKGDFTLPPMAPGLYGQELKGQALAPHELAGQRDLTGFVYIDGDVELRNEGDSIAGSAVLMIDGGLIVDGTGSLKGDFVILAADGIYLAGITEVKGLLYTPGDFHCYSRGASYIVGQIWSGGGVYLQGDITIKKYAGDQEELLLGLPPRLVAEKMWYRHKRSFIVP